MTAEDYEAERRAHAAYIKRKASKNPIKKFWWWLRRADDAYFHAKRNDPPASWKRY
jgi:hypothetical protein